MPIKFYSYFQPNLKVLEIQKKKKKIQKHAPRRRQLGFTTKALQGFIIGGKNKENMSPQFNTC